MHHLGSELNRKETVLKSQVLAHLGNNGQDYGKDPQETLSYQKGVDSKGEEKE